MFYIIERKDQLDKLGPFEDCFIHLIPCNSNFHPSLTQLSLVYIRPLDGRKGYMLCIDHNEAFKLNQIDVVKWLSNNGRLWLLDKKAAMHWVYPIRHKLFDAHLLEFVDLTDALSDSPCLDFYYMHHRNLPNVSCLIPISKHYEECEKIFEATLPVIKNNPITLQFEFQNNNTTEIFYEIEKNGIKLDKNCFIEHYKDKIDHPEFNISKGRIYTQYNLYTTTSRPSNTFNNINFAALNKDNGERKCYKPENDVFIEIDFQGYHPRLIGEMVDFEFPKDKNTYEYLGEILGVSKQEAKELTFKQLYGGVWNEYQDKPFFKQVNMFIDNIWDTYQYGNSYTTANKIFIRGDENVARNKLFNYIVQSYETSTNVQLLRSVLDYLDLENKKTKLVLYTYDAFLFDYSKEDGNIISDLTKILEYPVSIKQGKSYHGLINL
jgi:hypothetical protein